MGGVLSVPRGAAPLLQGQPVAGDLALFRRLLDGGSRTSDQTRDFYRFVVGLKGDLTDRLSAVDILKAAVAALGGKGGGGRPDMAQGGGPDGGKAAAALEAIEQALTAA